MGRIVFGLAAALCVAGCQSSGGSPQMKMSSVGLSAKSQNGIVLAGSQYSVLSTDAVFSLTPPAGVSVVSASWDFGDGSTASGLGPMYHSFFALGSYNIIATLTDSLGGHASLTVKVNVLPYDESLLCLSYLTLTTPDTATAGQPASASVNVPPCLAAQVTGYQWDYGDSSTPDTTATAADMHTYASAGDFDVSVVVTTTKGAFTLTGQISGE